MDVTCATCGETFPARNRKARYCSDRCRKAKGRAEVVELPVEQDDEAPAPKLGPVTTATLRDLVEADRVDTTLGQLCLTLARRIDEPRMDNGSQVATLAQKLADLLTTATRGTAKKTAPQQLQDELAARRERQGA